MLRMLLLSSLPRIAARRGSVAVVLIGVIFGTLNSSALLAATAPRYPVFAIKSYLGRCLGVQSPATTLAIADLISYVGNFVTDASGKRFNPHVTIGVGREAYLNKMLVEPFASFTFSPAGASVYQLGSFGAARKELRALTVTP
jgi:hypothetical protein